jgi:hypothetical protein
VVIVYTHVRKISMSHPHESPRHRRLGRLFAVLVVVVGLAGFSGCGQGTDPIPTARSSPSGTPREAAKAEIPPDTNPPAPETVGPLPAGFGSWTEVFDLQQRMNTAADRISTAGGATVGLAGIVAAPEARRLTVYWKGQPPRETLRLIGEIRADLPVDVLPARYSAVELSEIGRSVITRPGVVSVGGNVDGSGITVTVSGDVNVADWGVDVPATLKLGEQPFLVVCSRQDDCAPRWGGATYWSSGGVCNLGFTVWKNGTSLGAGGQKIDNNVDYMLSAGHCAKLGDVATTPNGASLSANVVADDDDRDTLPHSRTPLISSRADLH